MDYNLVYIQQYKFIYKQQTWFMYKNITLFTNSKQIMDKNITLFTNNKQIIYKNITLFTNSKQIIYILRQKILTEIFFQNQSIHWECFGLSLKCLQSKGTWTYFLRNKK